MEKAYQRITWENRPSRNTPLHSTNLNKMDLALDTIDDRVIALDTESSDLDSRVTAVESGKVDKVTGKGLSTEDYTTEEKTKLSGIAAGAEVNVQPDWEQGDSSADDYIKNKPDLTVDDSLNTSSTNPVQNLVITNALASKEDTADLSDDVEEIVSGLITPQSATITDGIAQFTTIEANPLKSLKADITPIQDLHGYSNPWVGGAGKNKFNYASATSSDFTNTNGTFSNSATDSKTTFTWQVQTMNGNTAVSTVGLSITTPGRYNLTVTIAENSGVNAIRIRHSGSSRNLNISYPFSTVGTWTISLEVTGVNPSTAGGLVIKDVQIESGSTATAYEPYENICPIYGHTQEVITNTDGDETTETYTIDLNGTRYGGTLDVTEGVLTVTDGYIAEYNGETLPSTWISDRDVYAPNTTPTTGAEVVYKLATPTTVTLTPTQITALLGVNNVSASTGAVSECKFTKMHTWDDIKAYIDSQMGE